jgi:hypothetical protein
MKFFIDGKECSTEEYLHRTNIVWEDDEEFNEDGLDESTELKLEMIEDILDIIEQNENEDGVAYYEDVIEDLLEYFEDVEFETKE